MRTFKVVVEKHPDGYTAYPLGIRGGVVGQGASYEEALADVARRHGEDWSKLKSVMRASGRYHVETY